MPNNCAIAQDYGSLELRIPGQNDSAGPDDVAQKIIRENFIKIDDVHTEFHSAGVISGFALSDAGGGSVATADGVLYIRTNNGANFPLKKFSMSGISNQVVPVDTTRYLGIEMDGGVPAIVLRSVSDWNGHSDFELGTINNEGGTLHITDSNHKAGDHAGQMIYRSRETAPFMRDNKGGGLLVSETGTRNIAMTAGAVWEGLSRIAIAAFDTSGADTFQAYYRDGVGGWSTQTAQSQWNNTQYDDGTGALATLGNNKWGIHWLYVGVDGDPYVVYGQAEYNTEALAETAGVPSQPPRFTDHAILIGRIVFQKSDATGMFQSAFGNTFNPSSGAFDAGNITYTPADVNNWDDAVDPGQTNDALDQLSTHHLLNTTLRNRFINGDFSVSQDGDTFNAVVSGDHVCDIWRHIRNGSGATINITRESFTLGQVDVPGEPKHYIRYDQTVAGTGSTSNKLQTIMEGVRTFAGKSLTLSFYAKANAATTFKNLRLTQNFGTGGSPSAIVNVAPSGSQALTTSWQKFTLRYDVPSISGKTLGTNGDDFLRFQFEFLENVVQTIEIADVQLEEGSVATDFERRPYGFELGLVQRYYAKLGLDADIGRMYISSTAATSRFILIKYPQSMRVAPTRTGVSDVGTVTYSGINKDSVTAEVSAGDTTSNRTLQSLTLDARF